jgi:hypothetical protein
MPTWASGLYWMGMDAKHPYPYLKRVKEKRQTQIQAKFLFQNYKKLQ